MNCGAIWTGTSLGHPVVDGVYLGLGLLLCLLHLLDLFTLLLDFSHQCFVHLGLACVHSAFLFRFFCNLLLQEVLRFSIDIFYFLLDAIIFLLPKVALLLPHDCLLVEVVLIVKLPLFLLFFLLRKRGLHFILSALSLLCFLFLIASQFHFSITLIFLNDHIFASLRLVHILQHPVSHPVHKLLRSTLPGSNLIQSILLLLVKHSCVGLLHIDVFEARLLALLPLHLIIALIFLKHSVVVLALLLLLF